MELKVKERKGYAAKLSARPDPDVRRMLERAKKDGRRPSRLINTALRELLKTLGYARKKDLTHKPRQ